jgi:serine/threonine protein kinase
MGEVYVAQDTRLDRRVALKILPAAFAHDDDRLARFIREAKSASALNHPNIITVYDIGETESTHFIAYEFIDGRTLREVASGGPLSVGSALEIGIQIALIKRTSTASACCCTNSRGPRHLPQTRRCIVRESGSPGVPGVRAAGHDLPSLANRWWRAVFA